MPKINSTVSLFHDSNKWFLTWEHYSVSKFQVQHKVVWDGEAELGAIFAELLHYQTKWKVKEESAKTQQGESSFADRAEAETLQSKFQSES